MLVNKREEFVAVGEMDCDPMEITVESSPSVTKVSYKKALQAEEPPVSSKQAKNPFRC